MSAVGGIPAAGGPAPAAAPRRDLPGPLVAVRVLLLVLLGATALGAIGLSGSAIAADAMGAQVLGILLYASAPGVLCALLAWHLRTGGRRVLWGTVAVQLWLIAGGLGNLADGSPDGFTQTRAARGHPGDAEPGREPGVVPAAAPGAEGYSRMPSTWAPMASAAIAEPERPDRAEGPWRRGGRGAAPVRRRAGRGGSRRGAAAGAGPARRGVCHRRQT